MRGSDVYEVLRNKDVDTLFHANTVTTSCTFLRSGGLASRGYVEDRGLPQTQQYTDDKDKQLGIWYDIFTDGVDIHERASRRNDYGPVLFILPATILLNLPQGTKVLVTRSNPIYWQKSHGNSDRYFMSPQELREGYSFGDFGKHVILRNRRGFLPFDNSPIRLLLDDPKRTLSGGADAYSQAVKRLRDAAREAGLTVRITKRQCRPTCKCLSGQAKSYDKVNLDFWF